MKKLTLFLREFQLFILLAIMMSFGFILSWINNEWEQLPVSFLFSMVGAILLPLAYPKEKEIEEKYACHGCGFIMDENDKMKIDEKGNYYCAVCGGISLNHKD